MSALHLPRRTTVVVATAVLGIAGLGAGVLAPAAVAAVSSTAAQSEKTGTCGDARYDAEVDRENGGLEASFELDRAKPGQQWQIVLKHNGETYFDKAMTVDREGEIDVEKNRTDAAGTDSFEMSAKQVNGPGSCSVALSR